MEMIHGSLTGQVIGFPCQNEWRPSHRPRSVVTVVSQFAGGYIYGSSHYSLIKNYIYINSGHLDY